MTIPTGTGIHRRMVYIELQEGYPFGEVAQKIKNDPYFAHDETHVMQVENVDTLLDMGHGVNLTRKGVSGKTQNQLFEFNMHINNPALTAQIMVSAPCHHTPATGLLLSHRNSNDRYALRRPGRTYQASSIKRCLIPFPGIFGNESESKSAKTIKADARVCFSAGHPMKDGLFYNPAMSRLFHRAGNGECL